MFERPSAIIAASALAACLTACGTPGPRPAPQSAAPAAAASAATAATAAAPALPPSGRSYRIDPAQSQLTLLVYRAGPLANLGHNHVIVNRQISGWVRYGGAPAEASFALTIPASGFLIDDPSDRSVEGGDFAAPVTDEAKAGTLRNMLSPALLDAAQFPAIGVRSVAIEGGGAEWRATLAVEVAGHASTIVAPVSLLTGPGRLSGAGSLALRQSALGLTPFSVLMGALRVQDEMRLSYRIVAIAN